MRLDVESLRTFRAVVEAGGVTRAARRLNLSQSAVSWKLKRLEERVGRPLTLVDARKMALTEDGQTLLEHAIRIVDAHDEAVARFKIGDLAGEVRVGITEDMAVDGVARVIGRFKRRYPHLALSMRIEQSKNLARWLASGEVDAALLQVRFDEIRPSDSVLKRDRLVWVAADKELSRVDPLPLVTFGPDCFYHPLMVKALHGIPRPHRVVVQAPTTAAVRAALLAGLGVGVLRTHQVTETPELVRLRGLTTALPAVAQIVRFSKDLPLRLVGPLRAIIMEPAVLAEIT